MTSTAAAASGAPACGSDREVAAAADLQRALLPPSPLAVDGWTAAHRFVPAGVVSGDYVDLVPLGDRLYFMLGDVSGKGVAASMLMAQMHAMFRTLVPFDLPLDLLVARASALVCVSSLPAQYATLVAGYLERDGRVVISNAGHPPPLALTRDGDAEVRATGVPLGMFCESQFTSAELHAASGDTLLVYSDGLTEARNQAGEEYGAVRLRNAVVGAPRLPVDALLDRAVRDQAQFRAGVPNLDDVTLLAIRRT